MVDRVVASQVEVALAGHPEMRRHRIDVECVSGEVTLELPAGPTPTWRSRFPGRGGTQNVNFRIAEIPVVTPFPG